MLPFEFDRRQHPVPGVLPGGVVEHLDVIEHVPARFIPRAVDLATEAFSLEQVEEALGHGDELVVVRLDRLARSVADLADIVRRMEEKGVSLRCVEQPVDTGSAAGRAFVGRLGVFAEFETGLRRERQMEGIAKAKREGEYKGRRRLSVSDDVARLAAEGQGPTAIAKVLGIGVATDHRGRAEQLDPV